MYKTLLELGCKPSLKGFKYLQSAINYVMENPDTYMGDVYYTVAQEYKIKWSCVERCMRHCIQVASSVGSASKWNSIFGYTVNPDTGSVTNKEFIFGVANHLKITKGPEKYWIVTLTENCGMSTTTMKVTGNTYTEAFTNAMMQLDADVLPSDPTRGIIGLEPVKI
jgi:hypothetical protein